jgi:hypothetical protein
MSNEKESWQLKLLKELKEITERIYKRRSTLEKKFLEIEKLEKEKEQRKKRELELKRKELLENKGKEQNKGGAVNITETEEDPLHRK